MVQINEENTAKSEARCTMTYFEREYIAVIAHHFFFESVLHNAHVGHPKPMQFPQTARETLATS